MININLVFAGHDFKFLERFIEYLKFNEKYNIRIDKWNGHNKHNIENSKCCLEWADTIFCEWGLGNALWYSQNKKENQKLIVRMHSQELKTEYNKSFNFNNINKIIAVSPYIYEEFATKINIPRSKMQVIYNYVDCNYFDQPKVNGCEYNLGIVGICPKIKRLDIAIDIFEKLWEKNSRYKLYIKGNHPKEYKWLWNRKEERKYYEELFNRIENSIYKSNIIFDGYGKDLDKWFTKIGYILSTSDFESFHLSVAEAMASGCIPIILNREGADTVYSQEYICNSVNELVDLIYKYRYLVGEEVIKEYPKYNFNIDKIIQEIENLF